MSALGVFLDEWGPALRLEWWTMLDTKQASKGIYHLINSLFFLIGTGVFIYMMFTNVRSALNSPYVSLETTNADQVCNDVPGPVVGRFDIDYYGHYSSDSAFQEGFSIFQLVVPGVLLTMDSYKNLIADFAAEFKLVGDRSATRQVPWSLAAWASMYAIDPATKIKYTPITTPARLFEEVSAVNSYPRSKAGICLDPQTILYPTTTPASITGSTFDGALTIDIDGADLDVVDGKSIPYKIYITKAGNWDGISAYVEAYLPAYPGPCPNQFVPGNAFLYSGLGEIYGVDAASANPYSMSFEYDTVSTLIATAVNMGIIPIAKLTRVLIHTTQDRFGANENVKSFVHPFHKDMEPILCMSAGSNYLDGNSVTQTMPADFCAVVAGAEFIAFYPFITAIAGDESACTCSSTDDFCNEGAMRVSMIFSKDGTNLSPLYDLAATLGTFIKNDRVNGDTTQQSKINALYTSCLVPANPNPNPLSDSTCQAAWVAAVGPISSDDVGMFTFHVFPEDSVSYFTPIALPLKELQYTSAAAQGCKNTLYNSAAYSALQADVPVPLKQAYYSCTTKPYNAIKAEIGNAYGFVMLFVNIFLLALLICIYAWDRKQIYHVAFQADESAANIASVVPTKDIELTSPP